MSDRRTMGITGDTLTQPIQSHPINGSLRWEQERELTIEFLRLINTNDSIRILIDATVNFFQQQSQCQSVAIRLRRGSEFPYFQTLGFSEEFLSCENNLCARDSRGEIIPDGNGDATLECRCGDVISGRSDTAQPFFTALGSFWTNNSSDDRLPTGGPLLQRGRCSREGYQSIALIALKAGKQRIGLLQLNDHRAGCFTREKIQFWEGLAHHLAIALARLLAEETLHESEQRLLKVNDIARIGIFEYVHATGVTHDSQTFRAIYGLDSNIPATLNQVQARILPDDREPLLAAIRQSIDPDGNGLLQHEHRILRPDGIRWLFVSAQTFFEGERAVRHPVHTIGAIIDITARKQAEEQTKALEEQFRHAQKMEAVGRLAGAIAHDFNNLLMVIRSYAEILEDSLPALDDARRNTQAILHAADRAANLTSQMLAFSRKQVLSPVPLNLNDAVEESSKLLQRIIGEDIELRVKTAPCLWTVRADPGQIVQVLIHLSVNSRDAMPVGGILTLETRNVTAGPSLIESHSFLTPGDYAVLSVIDTGTGISKDVQERMYEPFFTTKCVGKGTGLGLSTVYGIVKQSGGYLLCESEPGQGASFSVYLPRIHDERCEAAQSGASGLLHGNETILLVEDEDALRESMSHFLTSLGYTVLAAGSGSHALAIAHQFKQPIHLMISDVVMPRISGHELSQMLGSIRPDMKTVFMSGYIDDAIVRHGVQVEGVAFLQKPFSLAVLARKLRTLLG